MDCVRGIDRGQRNTRVCLTARGIRGGHAAVQMESIQGQGWKNYDYPKWDDAGGGKRWLSIAQGWLSFSETPPITKVIFKVYRHGDRRVAGNATPVITVELNPVPTYTGFPINAWLLTSGDPTIPKIQFNDAEELQDCLDRHDEGPKQCGDGYGCGGARHGAVPPERFSVWS